MSEQNLTPFNVTLPWNVNNDDEGDYRTTTWAATEDDAVQQVAEEMADSGAKQFDTEEERRSYIRALTQDGGTVTTVAGDLEYNLRELFPELRCGNLNLSVLRQVLQENQERLFQAQVAS